MIETGTTFEMIEDTDPGQERSGGIEADPGIEEGKGEIEATQETGTAGDIAKAKGMEAGIGGTGIERKVGVGIGIEHGEVGICNPAADRQG